jgi:hypothetical protein
MTLENRNELKATIEDLQREYRLLEDGKLLVVFDAAPGVNQGSSIRARKETIRNEIDSIEFFLKVSGWDVSTISNVPLWSPSTTSSSPARAQDDTQ